MAPPPPPDARLVAVWRSAEETRRLARRLGRLAAGPLVIALIGELGSGKTLFVQGLARGLGVPEGTAVTSPTFTLVHHYAGRLPLAHVDLYRLEAPVAMEELGLEELFDGAGVCAVEWADRLPAGALAERLEIRLTIAGAGRRRIVASAYGQAAATLLKAWGSFFPPSGPEGAEEPWD